MPLAPHAYIKTLPARASAKDKKKKKKKEMKDNSFRKRFFSTISTHDSLRYQDRICVIRPNPDARSRVSLYRCNRLQGDGTRLYLNTSMNLLQPINQLARGTCYTFPRLFRPASSFQLPDKRATYTCKHERIRAIVPLRSVAAAATFSSVCLLFLGDSGVQGAPSCPLRMILMLVSIKVV